MKAFDSHRPSLEISSPKVANRSHSSDLVTGFSDSGGYSRGREPLNRTAYVP